MYGVWETKLNTASLTNHSTWGGSKIVSVENGKNNTIKLLIMRRESFYPGKKQVWQITSREKQVRRGLHL